MAPHIVVAVAWALHAQHGEAAAAYPTLLDRSEEQANRTAQNFSGKYPTLTSPQASSQEGVLNEWIMKPGGNWVSGFFPGTLWQLYDITGKDEWATLALQWTEGLRDQQHDTGDHDIGFKIFNSFGAGLLLAKEGSFAEKEVERLGYKDVVLTAAKSLATRFDEVVGCTKSWSWYKGVCSTDASYVATFPVIIDNMMNLELLFWASQNGGDPDLHRLAESHANKTAMNHVRADSSTNHVVDYDPTTGEVAKKCTHQGRDDASTWSRGQGWCIYGFTMAYRYTSLPLHLSTAVRCADYFLDKLEAQVNDSVPLWDFDWSGERGPDQRDVSAAVVVASALFELAGYVGTPSERYREAAAKMTSSVEAGYLGDFDRTVGTLVHGMVMNPEFDPPGQDVSLPYADYYALETLRRAAATTSIAMV